MKTNSPLPPLMNGYGRILKKKLGVSILVILILSFNVMAQNTANIIVQPSAITANSSSSFNVNVRVDFTTAPASSSVDAIEVHLNFDKTKLQVASITKPASGIFTSEPIPLEGTSIINNNGRINYAAAAASNFPNADFDFLTITFNVIGGTGTTTPLTFLTTFPNKTDAQRMGLSILGSVGNGSVSINASCPTPPSATISTTGGTICNGQPIKLYLSDATGTGPFDLVVNGITYNDVSVSTSTEFVSIPFPTNKVWPGNPTPALPQNNDGAAIEVGTKIRSTVAGYIKGIRFYNGFANPSGTYTGKLWNGTTLLASADYTTVSGAGWKEVVFATPVQIAANTTYIASVFSSAGNYAVTDGYFNNAATSGPITAPKDGDFGPNGLYRMGAGVPNTAYMKSNYWVDVLFVPSALTFDLTSVTDATGCAVTGSLQSLNVLSLNCGTLPVTLLNFSASPGTRKVTLHWTTSQEINNRGFDIERSDNGTSWTKIGFVHGAGNSNSQLSYSYLDQNLEPRKYYYRLKQLDIDDRFRYSAIVSATLNGKPEFVLGQNYPNPFNGQTTIQFVLPRAEQVNLSLFDINGRVVKVLVNGTKDAGNHAISFNAGSLSKGVYYYRIQAGDFSDVKKLTIQ